MRELLMGRSEEEVVGFVGGGHERKVVGGRLLEKGWRDGGEEQDDDDNDGHVGGIFRPGGSRMEVWDWKCEGFGICDGSDGRGGRGRVLYIAPPLLGWV